jgi:hypothetical protein
MRKKKQYQKPKVKIRKLSINLFINEQNLNSMNRILLAAEHHLT